MGFYTIIDRIRIKMKELLVNNNFFSNPKPLVLIKDFLEIGSKDNDLILDFFAGSGTTAHAIMELNAEDGGNRKYICVQMPELCDEKSEASKAGYTTIAEISKERIRRAGKKIKSELGLDGLKDDRILDKNKKNEPQLFEEKILESTNPKNPNPDILESSNPNLDTGFKVLKLADSNFKQWRSDLGKRCKRSHSTNAIVYRPSFRKCHYRKHGV